MKQKISLCLFIILTVLILCTTGCENKETVIDETTITETTANELETSSTEETTIETEIETTTENLVDSFGEVLAYGVEENGDEYYMVAEESEDYNGVNLKIGIIKNNKWLLKPTSKMPFIDEDNTIYGIATSIEENDEDFLYSRYQVLYIGNGCFLCEGVCKGVYSNLLEGTICAVVYNSNTKEYYEKNFDRENKHICVTYNCLTGFYTSRTPNYDAMHYLSKSNSMLIVGINNYSDYSELYLIDTNTMEESVITTTCDTSYVNPVSENVIVTSNNYSNHNEVYFFGMDGKEIFENDFVLATTDQTIVFDNGKCTFNILNNNDTEYTVTINKKGKVIDSY